MRKLEVLMTTYKVIVPVSPSDSTTGVVNVLADGFSVTDGVLSFYGSTVDPKTEEYRTVAVFAANHWLRILT